MDYTATSWDTGAYHLSFAVKHSKWIDVFQKENLAHYRFWPNVLEYRREVLFHKIVYYDTFRVCEWIQ